nr:hypothetical protein [uncultured Chloroflexus sp.]
MSREYFVIGFDGLALNDDQPTDEQINPQRCGEGCVFVLDLTFLVLNINTGLR